MTRLTRRGLLAAVAALPAAAQQPPPAPPLPATPAEETTAANSRLQSNFDRMRKVKLPFFTEPATRFKA